jgi:hypothetical protein
MFSPLRHPTAFSSASSSQPGSSIQNPLRSIGVRAHPNEEYREIGYPVFDGFGNRMTQFDNDYNAVVRHNTEVDQADAFYDQYDHIWEIIGMGQAMADAGADESIHYSMHKPRIMFDIY